MIHNKANIAITITINVDAEDLIGMVGFERARELVFKAFKNEFNEEDIRTEMDNRIGSVGDYPVAVRDVVIS
jgi:hypothetical protein